MRGALAAFAAALALVIAAPAAAQGPEAPWRTLATGRFRVHFPAPFAAYAERLAARLESDAERVAAAVAYFPSGTIDVVVADPMAAANGSAWPWLGAAKIVLWTSSPAATSTLGHFGDFPQLVTLHELTHVAHLARPSRDPLEARWLARLVPLGPIERKSPRWVDEGYATLLEGALTGSGRPNSPLRRAILDRFAAAGRLPSYRGLDSTDDRFLASSMAYLAGSAYLEWLAARESPGALDRLWRRLSAREHRDFATAFRGVFGDDPAILYARFAAEWTRDALAREAAIEPERREGERFLDLAGSSGAPALSPDGRRLALVERRPKTLDRLVVISTEPDPEAAERERAARERLLARDPEDVPARASGAPRRRELAALEAPVGGRFAGGRWLADGSAILFASLETAADGVRHSDLRLWRPGAAPRRVTRFADLADADPAPDGASAVAVRQRHGFSQLVRVDLASGDVAALLPPSLETVYESPRLAPDGATLAWLEHAGGRWRAEVREAASGATREIAVRDGGEPLSLAWGDGGRLLYAAIATDDGISIDALPVADGAIGHRVTRALGAALAPVPSADGRTLYYLALDPDGLGVRRLALDAATIQPPESVTSSSGEPPSVATAAPVGIDAPAAAPPSRPYGLGRFEWQPLAGGTLATGGGSLLAGARGGDLLGRGELLAEIASGGAERGGALALAWRGAPVEIALTAVAVRERERRTRAVALAAQRSWSATRGHADLALALVDGSVAIGDGERRFRRFATLSIALAATLGHDRFRLTPTLAASATRGLGEATADFARLALAFDLRTAAFAVEGLAEDRQASDVRRDLDRLRVGGPPALLSPAEVAPERIALPELPVDAFVGERFDRLRLALGRPDSPLRLFYERVRPRGGRDSGSWVAIAGVAGSWKIAATPLARWPATDLTAGAARVLDEVGFGRTRLWASVRFRVR